MECGGVEMCSAQACDCAVQSMVFQKLLKCLGVLFLGAEEGTMCRSYQNFWYVLWGIGVEML